MSNKKIQDLTSNPTPSSVDYLYVAERSGINSYLDRKVSFLNFSKFLNISKTSIIGYTYSITSSQLDKRWFSNQGAIATIQYFLPPTEDGKEIGFVLEENFRIKVTPNSSDKIIPLSNVDGESIECNVLGSSIYLKGCADGWMIILNPTSNWSVSA